MNRDRTVDTWLRTGKLLPRDISESLGKLPPQALDLEEAVLGAVMLERQAQVTALEILTPNDFYSEAHKEIFAAIAALAQKGDGIDMLTVVQQLRKDGKIEIVGGAYAVTSLTDKVSSSANIKEYAYVLIEKRMARDLIQMASEIHHRAYEDTEDIFALLDFVKQFPLKVYDKLNTGQIKHIKQGVEQLAQSINKRTADAPEINGVPSGYFALDKVTRGWQDSDFIILAARPGMGKTTFALNMARNAAIDFKVPVGIFSLEMAFIQLTNKLTSHETDIDLKILTTKQLTDLEWNVFHHKTGQLVNSPIYIDDTAAISITDLRVRARKMYEELGVRIFFIDYLQLMKAPPGFRGNREGEISEISRGCKQVAKELNVPVIALSQLSRDVEKRGKPFIPKLADLRESGSLEQDADIVAFLWRPDYYKISGDDRGTFVSGCTKIIIAKHRNGDLAEPAVGFRGRISKFVNIDSPYEGGGVSQATPDLFDRTITPLRDYTEPIKPAANEDDLPF